MSDEDLHKKESYWEGIWKLKVHADFLFSTSFKVPIAFVSKFGSNHVSLDNNKD